MNCEEAKKIGIKVMIIRSTKKPGEFISATRKSKSKNDGKVN